jgi:two-component system, NarL family, sensor kinase
VSSERQPNAITRPPWWRFIGWVVVAVVASIIQPMLLVDRLRRDLPGEALVNVMLLAGPVVGALLIQRAPANRLSWALLTAGVAQHVGVVVVEDRFVLAPSSEPSAWLAVLGDLMAVTTTLAVLLLVVVFPTGSPWGRIGTVASGALWWAAAGMLVVTLFAPFAEGSHPDVVHPIGIDVLAPSALLGAVLAGSAMAAMLVALVGGIASNIGRWRAGDGIVRAQLAALAYPVVVGLLLSAGVAIASMFVVVPAGVEQLQPAPFVVGIPFAIGAAILRHRLLDIRLLINRTLLYTVLAGGLFVVYLAAVAVFGVLLIGGQGWVSPVLAAGVAALAFHPLRQKLQAAADRRLFGARNDPYAGVLAMQGHVVIAEDSADVARAVARGIAEAMRVPYVRLEVDGLLLVEVGESGPPERELDLVHGQARLGRLAVAQRSYRERFDRRDEQLLTHLSDQAAVALVASRAANDAKVARERLAAAVEDERLRLRRDLHDELGPRLTGIGFVLEAARTAASSPPVDLLNQVADEVREALLSVRQIARDLRPPVLDELGLVGAIRASADRLRPSGLDIEVELPSACPPLPPRTETAALRIVDEALTNVARHAGASHVRVSLSLERDLRLEVRDDGQGLPHDLEPGVGIRSMTERARGAGGSISIRTGSGGSNSSGTTVIAHLPVGTTDG